MISANSASLRPRVGGSRLLPVLSAILFCCCISTAHGAIYAAEVVLTNGCSRTIDVTVNIDSDDGEYTYSKSATISPGSRYTFTACTLCSGSFGTCRSFGWSYSGEASFCGATWSNSGGDDVCGLGGGFSYSSTLTCDDGCEAPDAAPYYPPVPTGPSSSTFQPAPAPVYQTLPAPFIVAVPEPALPFIDPGPPLSLPPVNPTATKPTTFVPVYLTFTSTEPRPLTTTWRYNTEPFKFALSSIAQVPQDWIDVEYPLLGLPTAVIKEQVEVEAKVYTDYPEEVKRMLEASIVDGFLANQIKAAKPERTVISANVQSPLSSSASRVIANVGAIFGGALGGIAVLWL